MTAREFLVPDQMSSSTAAELLRNALDLREREPVDSDRTWFDTFDGLLFAAGHSLVHESGQLALLDRADGGVRAALRAALPSRPLLAHELPAGELRDALAPIAELRAMLPLVHLRCRVTPLDLLDDERKTVVRISLEQPALVSSTGRHTALRPRLRLTGVRGYDKALTRLATRLTDELQFTAAEQLLGDEALRATGRAPGGTSSKVDVTLSGDQRADAAAAAVLRRLAEVIEDNLPGAIADVDVEFLHDLRVAVRRTRAVQRELRHVFGPDALAGFRRQFRWLQQITGDSRDLDVYVLEFDSLRELVPASVSPDLEPLLQVLRARRALARQEMVRALRAKRTARLLQDWSAFLEELVEQPAADRPDATRTIAALAGERIRKVYRRMVRDGEQILAAQVTGTAEGAKQPPEGGPGDLPAVEFHSLRKKGKELRYLLELFGVPLFPADVVKPMIKTLKALQDVLGRHQDREVQVAMLRSLRDEVALTAQGHAALMAMGVLVEQLRADEQAARSEFASHFAPFAARSQRRLVRDTFA